MDGCMDGWVGGWMNSKLWSLILWLYVLELFFLWRLDLCRFAISLGPGLGLLSLCTVSRSIHQLWTRHLPLLVLHIPSGRINLCPSSSWHFLHESLQPNPSSKLLTHTPKCLLPTWTSQGSPKSTCPRENSLFSPQTHSYPSIFPFWGVTPLFPLLKAEDHSADLHHPSPGQKQWPPAGPPSYPTRADFSDRISMLAPSV